MITRKSMLGLCLALILPMLIAGCGGGGGSDIGTRPDLSGANNAAEPVAAQDAFVDAVNGIIATTSDVTEPVSIDSIMTTSPDNTAPVPLS
ncbi:MAG: hypothetical protein NVSMB28_17280 [Collimonas sp.]